MPKARRDTNGLIMWFCPGCGYLHAVDKRWRFNNDFEKPTLSPSVLNHIPVSPNSVKELRCHCYIRDGKIEFLNDCNHELVGKIVEMEEI